MQHLSLQIVISQLAGNAPAVMLHQLPENLELLLAWWQSLLLPPPPSSNQRLWVSSTSYLMQQLSMFKWQIDFQRMINAMIVSLLHSEVYLLMVRQMIHKRALATLQADSYNQGLTFQLIIEWAYHLLTISQLSFYSCHQSSCSLLVYYDSNVLSSLNPVLNTLPAWVTYIFHCMIQNI